MKKTIKLTTRTKEAVKTGLAMAIAYGIALQMDWDRPYWAAFAVAFISLPTAGQSLHKGARRRLRHQPESEAGQPGCREPADHGLGGCQQLLGYRVF